MKSRSGITLVFLVIIIIVLVIITGITIREVRGRDYINQTKNTVHDYDKEKILTQIKLEIRQYRIKNESSGIYEDDKDEIEDIIEKNGEIDYDEKVLNIKKDDEVIFSIPFNEIDSNLESLLLTND